MKKLLKNKQAIALLVVLSIVSTPAVHAYTQEFANTAANIHLQSFPVIEEKEPIKEFKMPQGLGDLLKIFRSKRELGLRKFDEREKREIAFKQMPQKPAFKEEVIDAPFVEKMLLVRGDSGRPMDHLMTRLTTAANGKSLLKTTAGAKRFVEMITQPTTNIDVLKKRQEIILQLVNNNALRTKCNNLLTKMQRAEPLVYDLYSRNSDNEAEKMKAVDSQFKLTETNILTITTRTQEAGEIIAITLPFIAALGGTINVAVAKETQDKTIAGIEAGFGTAFTSIFAFGGLTQMKLGLHVRLNMQERLIGMATYLTALKKLIYTVGKNSTIGPLMPELKTISQQLHHDQEASKGFNTLNKLLSTSTFAKEKPSAFSSPGRIVNSYREMIKEDVRKEYAQAMNLLGELDVYVALANKIKAHENENAQFCFVDFIEQSDKPMIKAVDFWNPFVDYKTVVGNDVSLNTGNERNIVLTGPNTGGKSTIMKALMISELLAQTFGIAPAKSLTTTPFTKLITYLNIADDTGAGISLFKAEINRAKEIIETLRSLPQNEFAFVILDEIFTGTSPDKAEELSYKFITQLNQFKNCIFIDATHFKKLTELEKATNGECKNYYTGVVIEDGKVVKYTYKLVPGVSPISTASQIAEEEGVLNF